MFDGQLLSETQVALVRGLLLAIGLAAAGAAAGFLEDAGEVGGIAGMIVPAAAVGLRSLEGYLDKLKNEWRRKPRKYLDGPED